MLDPNQTSEPQPFLPRIRMVWFFVVVFVVAATLGIVRSAEQGRALAAALVFTTIFVGLCAFLSGACFTVAYLFGAMERAVTGQQNQPASPFSDDAMPEQIIPPRMVDEN